MKSPSVSLLAFALASTCQAHPDPSRQPSTAYLDALDLATEVIEVARRGAPDAPDGYTPVPTNCPSTRPSVRAATGLSPQVRPLSVIPSTYRTLIANFDPGIIMVSQTSFNASTMATLIPKTVVLGRPLLSRLPRQLAHVSAVNTKLGVTHECPILSAQCLICFPGLTLPISIPPPT